VVCYWRAELSFVEIIDIVCFQLIKSVADGRQCRLADKMLYALNRNIMIEAYKYDFMS